MDNYYYALHSQDENSQNTLMTIQTPLYSRIRSSCSECGYLITKQGVECTTKSTNLVKYRAKLFATTNITNGTIDAIQAWTKRETLTVTGLRLYFENDCPVVIESLKSPLSNCFEEGSNQSASNMTVLVITTSLICAILFIIVVILSVYIVYKRYLPQTCKNPFRYVHTAWFQKCETVTSLGDTVISNIDK